MLRQVGQPILQAESEVLRHPLLVHRRHCTEVCGRANVDDVAVTTTWPAAAAAVCVLSVFCDAVHSWSPSWNVQV